MSSRILVYGADHPLGARVLASLRSQSWATTEEVRSPPSALSTEALRGVDGIVNCTAGSGPSVAAFARALYASLGRACATLRVVHLGSMTVYGSADRPVDETSEPGTRLSAYGAGQLEAERCAARYPNSVTLRLGCEYGPSCDEWSERVARWLATRRIGDLGAAGDGTCNLLYVDDLVHAVGSALRTPGAGGGIFNLAMRSPPTWNEYFERFGMALGAVPIGRIGRRRLRLETLLLAPPLKALQIAARPLPRVRARIAPPIPPSFARLCAQHITLDVSRAERVLGMTWTPLDQGLRTTASAILRAAGRSPP